MAQRKKLPSAEEQYQFDRTPKKRIVDCMAAYLLGWEGNPRPTMEDVAKRIVPGTPNYAFYVSMFHRFYNFSDRNGGRYRPGCKFEQTLGRQITRADIEAFVRTYPHGTRDTGITFEEFLLNSPPSPPPPPINIIVFSFILGVILAIILIRRLLNGTLLLKWKSSLVLGIFTWACMEIVRTKGNIA